MKTFFGNCLENETNNKNELTKWIIIKTTLKL